MNIGLFTGGHVALSFSLQLGGYPMHEPCVIPCSAACPWQLWSCQWTYSRPWRSSCTRTAPSRHTDTFMQTLTCAIWSGPPYGPWLLVVFLLGAMHFPRLCWIHADSQKLLLQEPKWFPCQQCYPNFGLRWLQVDFRVFFLSPSLVVAISNTYKVVTCFIGSSKRDGKWLWRCAS